MMTQRIYAPSSLVISRMSPATSAAAVIAKRPPVRADHRLTGCAAPSLGSSPITSLAGVLTDSHQRRRQACRSGIATNPRVRRRPGRTMVGLAVPPSTMASQTSTSMAQPQPQPPSTPSQTAGIRRVWRTPTKWASRKFARIFRSLSASAVVSAVSSTSSANLADNADTPRHCRLRRCRLQQASMQQMVQLLPAPAETAATQPGGKVLLRHLDGSRTLLLRRPPSGRFGFFLAKRSGGAAYITRFADASLLSWYAGLLNVGDIVDSIAGLRPDGVSLDAVSAHIGGRTVLEIRVR